MENVRQGEIVSFDTSNMKALALSKDFFNQTGMVIVCPVVGKTSPDVLHVPVETESFKGIAMLEQMKSMDLRVRRYRTLGVVPFDKLQEISDIVQSIFDYYPFSLQ